MEGSVEAMGTYKSRFWGLLGLGLSAWLATGPGFAASSTVELTGYTKQSGYALIEIDDQAVAGKIQFTIDLQTPAQGRVVGLFLNFLAPPPGGFTPASVAGDQVTKVAFDTKDLGQGNNVNPSPSERPKGLFDLGVAFLGNGRVVLTLDNPGGVWDCTSFGPFAMRVERAGGAAVKLYGVPVLMGAGRRGNREKRSEAAVQKRAGETLSALAR
jgi:hypothetical protein